MKIKLVLGLAILALAVSCGWQVASCEIANLQLKDDLHDLASQAGSTIGLLAPQTENDFRNAVLKKARAHDIDLQPGEITVWMKREHLKTGDHSVVFLAVDYSAPIHLPGHPFAIHFNPTSVE